MADVEIITLFNFLPEMPAAIQVGVGRLIRKAAYDIQAQAQRRAPVAKKDGGTLKNSIYTVTVFESGYSRASQTLNPTAEILPEVQKPTSHTEATVAVGASYGIYQEFGTRYMPAQPYLTPAVEIVRPELIASIRAVEGWLGLPGASSITPEPTDPGTV